MVLREAAQTAVELPATVRSPWCVRRMRSSGIPAPALPNVTPDSARSGVTWADGCRAVGLRAGTCVYAPTSSVQAWTPGRIRAGTAVRPANASSSPGQVRPRAAISAIRLAPIATTPTVLITTPWGTARRRLGGPAVPRSTARTARPRTVGLASFQRVHAAGRGASASSLDRRGTPDNALLGLWRGPSQA